MFWFLVFFAVVNVYTTHMPEISTTLPTIIMQDEPTTINTSTSATTLNNRLGMASEQPPYSLLGEDLMKHSFSDDGCSSDDRSDIEIDI